jgi:hypothetical protein
VERCWVHSEHVTVRPGSWGIGLQGYQPTQYASDDLYHVVASRLHAELVEADVRLVVLRHSRDR